MDSHSTSAAKSSICYTQYAFRFTCWNPFFPSDGSMENFSLVSTPAKSFQHYSREKEERHVCNDAQTSIYFLIFNENFCLKKS